MDRLHACLCLSVPLPSWRAGEGWALRVKPSGPAVLPSGSVPSPCCVCGRGGDWLSLPLSSLCLSACVCLPGLCPVRLHTEPGPALCQGILGRLKGFAGYPVWSSVSDTKWVIDLCRPLPPSPQEHLSGTVASAVGSDLPRGWQGLRLWGQVSGGGWPAC